MPRIGISAEGISEGLIAKAIRYLANYGCYTIRGQPGDLSV
jgi:hypothetical protein